MLQLAALDNVTLLEGNHEANLRDYGLPDGIASKEFRMQTAPELAQAGLSRKAVYNFYRKLSQCFCYTYRGKKVLVSHGGLARMPENLSLVATAELIYGTGVYEDALDVDMSFAKHAAANEYQVHGHRNYDGVPEDGFAVVTVGNALEYLDKKKGAKDSKANAKIENVQQLLANFAGNPLIKEKSFGVISSFNFTRDAFYNKAWDDVTCKARGLYINKRTEKIVARSYDKFFNLDERPETKLNALRHNLQFPVQAYVKVNGFLGIVGYDNAQKKLLVTSKGDMYGLYAKIFKNTLAAELKERMQLLEDFVKTNNCSVIFECIEPEMDPHIIEYRKPQVVLLEIIENELSFAHRPYAELVALGEQLQVEIKEQACTLTSWDELQAWLKRLCRRIICMTESILKALLSRTAGIL